MCRKHAELEQIWTFSNFNTSYFVPDSIILESFHDAMVVHDYAT